MHFDDRLATVLRHRATGDAIARIQYRQLLDLLGTLPAEARGDRIDAAYARLAELSAALPAAERSAMLHEPGLRLRSPRLVAELAVGEPQVAAAAIERAQLGEEQWLDLAPALPIRARGVMRRRRDLGPAVEERMARLGIGERGLPPTADAVAARAAAEPLHPQAGEGSGSIRSLVKRIEDFRKNRQAGASMALRGDAPRLPLEDGGFEPAPPPRAFDFATDGDGRIAWASPRIAPMAVGLRLADAEAGAPVSASPGLALALRRRLPLRGERIAIAGAPAIAGRWQVDAAPRFDPGSARFIGYVGRMRRTARSAPPPPVPTDAQADRIRQLLHELRTPINAIQGFAEVIQQQLFEPTPHEYRALAASIAGDAARMLAGFEELERLARLDSGALELDAGDCDLAALLASTVARLEPFAAPRRSGFALELKHAHLPVALARSEADRLVWRLLATLAGTSAPGEVLQLRARLRGGQVRLTLQLPSGIAARSDEDLFRAATPGGPQALSAGMFGTGFALRLARAEAQAAGGALERRGEKLRLSLPGLTGRPADHSHNGGAADG